MGEGLDEFDLKIISALAEEGRMSWSELSDRIGLSQTPTLRRVRALEAQGFITGYHAVIDEAKLGGAISVFVSVTLNAQTEDALATFEAHVAEMPSVMTCFMMTGTADYLMRVVVPNLQAFQAFISKLACVPGVARLTSSFAVKQVVRRTAPPLPERHLLGKP